MSRVDIFARFCVDGTGNGIHEVAKLMPHPGDRWLRPDTAGAPCGALLYRDFASFAAYCFRELNPRARFAMNWHVEVMAGKVAAVRRARIRRLMAASSRAV